MVDKVSYKSLTDVDLKRVQKRLIKIACVIEEILNKHNIPHCIMYGSLLGAIRDGGFIPWDDDFDFTVFNEYYDDALDCLRSDLPDWLFLEYKDTEPKFFHAWARVKDLNTVVEAGHYLQDNAYAHHGLAVDLLRLEKVKLCDLCARGEDEFIYYVSRRIALGSMNEDEAQERWNRLAKSTSYFWSNKIKSEDVDSIKREVYASIYINRMYYEIDDFFPLKKYKFGDVEFWGPNKGEEILTKCYGDYMTLPPEEKRIPHYSKVEFLD